MKKLMKQKADVKYSYNRCFKVFTVLIVSLFISNSVCRASERSRSDSFMKSYNVVWSSQSENASESMPLGGGDIGLNVWVEKNDILFYIGKSGCFDENNQLLKLGRVRLKLTPNPFENGAVFSQILHLRDSFIEITGSRNKQQTTVMLWVDVYRPVIHLEIESSNPFSIEVSYESWRTEDREIPFGMRHPCLSYSGYTGKVVTYRDLIGFKDNGILWNHRNRDDKLLFDFSVKQQGLAEYSSHMWNPQKNLTFGGIIKGDGLVPAGTMTGKYADTPFTAWILKTGKPVKSQNIEIILHTAQAETQAVWEQELKDLSVYAGNNPEKAKTDTRIWWNDFWKRSYIHIHDSETGNVDQPYNIGRNYQLFRYMLGCNASGEYPTKFNGGLFTCDPVYTRDNIHETPDYRAWGGGSHTAQNQRLVYWPMLKSGDFDMMRPQFDFYRRALGNAELRSRVYWGHEGCCFTEHPEIFGLPFAGGWGFDDPQSPRYRPPDTEFGVQCNSYVKYQYNHQLEFSYMILEYLRFSGDDISDYLPFIESSLTFYDEHYRYRNIHRAGHPYDDKGKLVIFPSTALETYKNVSNPTDICAALKAVTMSLLDLPDSLLSSEKREKWSDFLTRIPDLSYGESSDCHRILFPAPEKPDRFNVEIPELYPVYPYDLIGIGKPELITAIDTWKYGDVPKNHVSWHQDAIFCARMGLTGEAKSITVKKLSDSGRRFPAFWGPGHDWVPDHNWGGSGMIGLQEMLMQTSGKTIRLLPAWPKEWNVDFKLHAPYHTTVTGKARNGKIIELNVSPESRLKDVVIPDI